MTPAQRETVERLKAEGFEFITGNHEVTRLTKGADKRIVFPDGSQKRGYHVDFKRGPVAGKECK